MKRRDEVPPAKAPPRKPTIPAPPESHPHEAPAAEPKVTTTLKERGTGAMTPPAFHDARIGTTPPSGRVQSVGTGVNDWLTAFIQNYDNAIAIKIAHFTDSAVNVGTTSDVEAALHQGHTASKLLQSFSSKDKVVVSRMLEDYLASFRTREQQLMKKLRSTELQEKTISYLRASLSASQAEVEGSKKREQRLEEEIHKLKKNSVSSVESSRANSNLMRQLAAITNELCDEKAEVEKLRGQLGEMRSDLEAKAVINEQLAQQLRELQEQRSPSRLPARQNAEQQTIALPSTKKSEVRSEGTQTAIKPAPAPQPDWAAVCSRREDVALAFGALHVRAHEQLLDDIHASEHKVRDSEIVLLQIELEARTSQVNAIKERLVMEQDAHKQTQTLLEKEQSHIVELNNEVQRVTALHSKAMTAHTPLRVSVEDIAVQSDHYADNESLQSSLSDTIRLVRTLQEDLASAKATATAPQKDKPESSPKPAANNDATKRDRESEVEMLRADRSKLVALVKAQCDALSKVQKKTTSDKWTQLRVDVPPLERVVRRVTASRSVGTDDDHRQAAQRSEISSPKVELVGRLDVVKDYLMTLERALDTTQNEALRRGLVDEIHCLHGEVLRAESPQGKFQFSMH